MRNSVVNIESVTNSSFGTGFVIDSDEKGIYVLTCQHVVDDVETPVVENVLAKVIAKGNFIDMAVLYVSKLHLEALPLQTQECDHLDVEVIGFSHFNKSLTQKKHINATLYQESIELHSKEDDAYYNVRKIKANDGFNFDRGNSGSPVICKSSGNIIAMISNKEGNDLAYAINIENLKEVWKDAPNKLFEKPSVVIEPVSGTKDEPTQETKKEPVTPTPKSSSSTLKYLIAFAIMLGVGFGTYTTLSPKAPTKEERLAQEKKAKEAEFKHQQELKAQEETKKREAQAKARAEARKREQLKREQEVREREAAKQRELQRKKEILAKTLAYEKEGYNSILKKEYNAALRAFKSADKLTPKYHYIRQIGTLLSKNINSMSKPITRRKVLLKILNQYSKYAPSGFSTNLRKQVKLPNLLHPELRLPTNTGPKVIDLSKVKVGKTPQLDLSKVQLGKPIKVIPKQ